jgi:two-component system response regulator
MSLETRVPSVTSDPVSLLIPKVQDPYLRVFHVNDSTDDQVLFQAACRKAQIPFNWHVTDSAEKGISYLKTLMEQAKNVPVCWPDLILLDIVMPLVSGFEVLKFIRATPELKDLPVVIFTGHPHPGHREESARLGANLFLMKPGDFQQIVDLAKNLYRLLKEIKAGSQYRPPTASNEN